MRSDSLVLRNSLWIGLQPLILNIVSIFVTGYIARTLGQDDYGRFVFAFAFVALLMPIGNLGLRAVAVRDIAADKENAIPVLGKILSLRILLSTLAFLLAVVIIHLMGHPSETRFIVYIAAFTLITHTAATTFFVMFQAHERMQYIAIANFISGTSLTVASVLVLLAGFRLIGLTVVYVAGSAVALITIAIFYFRHFRVLRLSMDYRFFWESLKKSLPFFVVGIVTILNIRIGIVLLSTLSGDTATGAYGASFSLIERLNILSDSLCTAIFPTIAALFAGSKIDDLRGILTKYSQYLLVIGLPLAVGTTLLSSQIINLIFGEQYINSAPILGLLAWNLPFFFLASLFGYTLGAMRLQRITAYISLVVMVINIVINLVLIPSMAGLGVAVSYLSIGVLSCVLTLFFVRRALKWNIHLGAALRVVAANIVLAITVLVLREFSWIVAMIAGALAYAGAAVVFKALRRDDWQVLKVAILGKRGA